MTIKDIGSKDIKLWKDSSKEAKFIDSIYENLKQYYIKQQRDWYTNERFVRWDHWFVYNKTLNTIQQLPIRNGEIRRTVNKIRTQVRGVKNFIKRNQPRWQVVPASSSDKAIEESVAYNKILQNVYDVNNFKSKLTDIVVNSLKFSVWILEASIIPHKDGQILDFWVNDTFDIFFDPEATSIHDSRFILKIVKKSIESIKNNSEYQVKLDITADNKEWASDYKDLLEKEKFNSEWMQKSLWDFDSVLLKELWVKTKWDNWEDKIRIITSVWNQVIRVKDTDYKRFPFFIYNPEREPNSIYSDPWIKDLISLNKSLDKSASVIETYNNRMLGGKWLARKWVEVSTISEKGAEIITYKGNVAPVQMSLQPLPSTPFVYMQSLERWIEEFGGIREASLGRAPGSLQSGKWVEALQASDAATVAEPIENLELFLAEVWEFILETIEHSQVISSSISDWKETIKYIWWESGEELSDTLMVRKRRVKVAIVPELAYSEEAKKETIFRLAEWGMIDQETLLEYLNVSNIWDIIDRVKQRKSEQFKEEMMKQKASHAKDSGWPEDSATLADQENMWLLAWQDVPLTPEALWTPEHLELHMIFLDENKWQMDEAAMQRFDEHIANEEQYSGMQSEQSSEVQWDQVQQVAPMESEVNNINNQMQ